MWPFFSLNVSLRSIVWSHGFQSSMCLDFFFKNTLRNLWYFFGTSSSGVFSMGFSYCASSVCIVLWAWYWMLYSSFSREARNADFSWSMSQCCGQCVIFTIPLVQSISGLWHFSQKNSRVNMFFSQVYYFRHDLLMMSLEFDNQLHCVGNASSRVLCSVNVIYTGIGLHKGISDTLCFLAHALSIKMAFAPKSRRALSFIKSFWLLASAIWMDRHISQAS